MQISFCLGNKKLCKKVHDSRIPRAQSSVKPVSRVWLIFFENKSLTLRKWAVLLERQLQLPKVWSFGNAQLPLKYYLRYFFCSFWSDYILSALHKNNKNKKSSKISNLRNSRIFQSEWRPRGPKAYKEPQYIIPLF